jgi:hypothetical protein
MPAVRALQVAFPTCKRNQLIPYMRAGHMAVVCYANETRETGSRSSRTRSSVQQLAAAHKQLQPCTVLRSTAAWRSEATLVNHAMMD